MSKKFFVRGSALLLSAFALAPFDSRAAGVLTVQVGDNKEKTVRLTLSSGQGATVVTANHPVVVGLTLLGADGAAIATALPDLTHGG